MFDDDLFAEELEAAESTAAEDQRTAKKAVAIARAKSRTMTRRANSERHLADIMPPPEMGTSVHVISRGDVDALSFLVHVLTTGGPVEDLTLSTWCMAQADVDEISQAIAVGMVGHCRFCVGEIFPNQYTDEYQQLRDLEATGKASVIVARNHSKVMAGADPSRGWYFVIESSSNVNTNPRIEQTAIHYDEDLYRFYADFFADLRDIDAKYHERMRTNA